MSWPNDHDLSVGHSLHACHLLMVLLALNIHQVGPFGSTIHDRPMIAPQASASNAKQAAGELTKEGYTWHYTKY